MDYTNKILEIVGDTNDLLRVSKENELKQTSLVYFNQNSEEIGDEIITITIGSTNETLTFPTFDKLLNKKIKITVETVD